MKALIVTADDVGLHRGMTTGAIRAHREGIVTACSVVANGRAFDDAAARLRDVPELDVGIHLTLVEEDPLTEGIRFPAKWPMFVPAFLAGFIPIRAIERELRAQIERALGSGLRVTHLNGHQHLHVLPRLFDLVLELGRTYGIPYIRTTTDRGGRAPLARRLAIGGLRALGGRAASRTRAAGLATNDRTVGIAEAGHVLDIPRLLDHVEGVTELVVHPGIGISGYAWGYDWQREFNALCAPSLPLELERRGIRLMRPSEVGRRISVRGPSDLSPTADA